MLQNKFTRSFQEESLQKVFKSLFTFIFFLKLWPRLVYTLNISQFDQYLTYYKGKITGTIRFDWIWDKASAVNFSAEEYSIYRPVTYFMMSYVIVMRIRYFLKLNWTKVILHQKRSQTPIHSDVVGGIVFDVCLFVF